MSGWSLCCPSLGHFKFSECQCMEWGGLDLTSEGREQRALGSLPGSQLNPSHFLVSKEVTSALTYEP